MTKKIFLIAGEASGDLLGSKLMRELKQQNSDIKFLGVGGDLMQKEGLHSIFPMSDLSVMGIFEVLPSLFKILKRIKETAQKIRDEKPDYIITIDSPDFNFRVIKKIQDLKTIKKVHLIAPSVWAYREGRAQKIAKLYDLLLAILPFEPPYFEKYGLKTIFIGHPIFEDAPDFSQKESQRKLFRQKYQIQDDELLICITPGSRNSEVKKIFSEFIGAVNLLSQQNLRLKIAIPLTSKTQNLVTQVAQEIKVQYFLIKTEEKKSMFFASDFALAKSGTNTLEFSLYKIPMIIAYKINFLSYLLIKTMIKIKFANLINLVSNKEIIPEMIQNNCQKNKIANQLKKLILNHALANQQIAQSQEALKTMGLGNNESSNTKATKAILSL